MLVLKKDSKRHVNYFALSNLTWIIHGSSGRVGISFYRRPSPTRRPIIDHQRYVSEPSIRILILVDQNDFYSLDHVTETD